MDKKKFFGGVGPELLRWAVTFSIDREYEGRLRLDASPDFVKWYERLGFVKLDVEPTLFEGVQYTPMELPSAKVNILLERIIAQTKTKKKEVKK